MIDKKEKIDDAVDEPNENEMMVSEEIYMTSGIHIGTRQKTADIKKFIYKIRNDGLYIIDVKQTDRKIKEAAKFLSKYDPSKVLVVCVRQYGQKPVRKLGEYTGFIIRDGRFRPGTLTNPNSKEYFEPDVIMLTDPLTDLQALHEARNIGIPVVALCDTNNETKYVDLVIPTNNKGRRALALVYWLLTREILKEQGKIKDYAEFTPAVEDFEAEI
ncbi:MAG: 30S ribosomal protein S2 [Candidatus Thermoplasmatota archaeon]